MNWKTDIIRAAKVSSRSILPSLLFLVLLGALGVLMLAM